MIGQRGNSDLELEDLNSPCKSQRLDNDSLLKQLHLLVRAEMVAAQWRRAVGLVLLGTTVTLWVASGFLASVCYS